MGSPGHEWMTLDLVASNGNVSFLQEAVKKENDRGGDFQYFLRQGDYGRNILHIGLSCDQYKWVEEAVKLLPRHVIQELVFQVGQWGYTPLHDAVRKGKMEIVKVLDEYVFEDDKVKLWSIQNKDGDTPLHFAVRRGHADVVKYLLEKYPSLAFILNNSLGTFLHEAATRGEMSILRAIVDSKIWDDEYKKKMLSVKDAEGNTPFHLAVIEDCLEAVQFLVERYPDLALAVNNKQETPLHLAATTGRIEIVKFLVHYHPDLALAVNNKQETPLHLAAIRGKTQVVVFLMDHYPDLALRVNSEEETALHLAATNGQTEIVELLVECHPQLARTVNNKQQTPLHLVITHYETYNGETTSEDGSVWRNRQCKRYKEISSRVSGELFTIS